MSRENPKQIQLKGQFVYDEEIANEAITPGMLAELRSDGKIQKHSTAGGFAERMFVVEDALQGKAINDNIGAGDLCPLHLELPGSEVFGFIKAGENIQKGDKLVSAGDGTLIAPGSLASAGLFKQVVAIARKDIDLTSSIAVNTRIPIRVV